MGEDRDRQMAESLRACQRSLRQATLDLSAAVGRLERRASPEVQAVAADARRSLERDAAEPENRMRAVLTDAHDTLRELVERVRPLFPRFLIAQLHQLAGTLRQDYAQGLFQPYTPYTTSTGMVLSSIDDAIVFNNFHEAVHLGYILALKRAVA